jgi:NAD-dependent SIR2 family protein deacetylase
MDYPFSPRANAYVRLIGLGVAAVLVLGAAVVFQTSLTPWVNSEEVYVNQPVPFSHKHHVSGLGIDCRYCHTSVQNSSSAGMPPTQTCMSCHSQVWTESEMLKPVRRSLKNDEPIQWNRVYDVPDYVYFNHSIHTNSGVACETCHGRVDQMPLMYEAEQMYMQWCLDCHRQPEKYLRPQKYIYAFGYDLPDETQRTVGARLVEEYDIRKDQLTNCSVCHR